MSAERRPCARHLGAGVLAVMCALCASRASGQDVTEPALKAAYLFKFAQRTEWPPDVLPPTGRFVACVYGDTPVGDALARTLQGRRLAGRTMTLMRVVLAGPLRSCHLLYVSGVTAPQWREVLAIVQGLPVLTISEADEFPIPGGIVQLVAETGTIRFDLNLALAKQSRLRLSATLLALANHVHDERAGVTR